MRWCLIAAVSAHSDEDIFLSFLVLSEMNTSLITLLLPKPKRFAVFIWGHCLWQIVENEFWRVVSWNSSGVWYVSARESAWRRFFFWEVAEWGNAESEPAEALRPRRGARSRGETHVTFTQISRLPIALCASPWNWPGALWAESCGPARSRDKLGGSYGKCESSKRLEHRPPSW